MGSSFRDLLVWQRSMTLAKCVYMATQRFPKQEFYGLTMQMRRAAVSVPSNIAEGQGRLTRGEFRNHLGIARGSLNEVETQLRLAVDLEFIDPASVLPVIDCASEVARMLNGLIQSLESSSPSAPTGNRKLETGNSSKPSRPRQELP